MPSIKINYAAPGATSSTGLTVLRTQGLKAYFTEYESTFKQTHPGGTPVAPTTDSQWFSNQYGSNLTYGSGTGTPGSNVFGSSVVDYQYAAQSLYGSKSAAFIATAGAGDYDAVGSNIGLLAYTFSQAPTHTLFGNLDKVAMGETINTLPSPSASGAYAMTKPVVEFTDLSTVINAGVKLVGSTWEIINRTDGLVGGVNTTSGSFLNGTTYGNNDVHNIVYDLMGRHGVSGPGQTTALQIYLNNNDLEHIGTTASEVFDGFNDNDLFKIGGGNDSIKGFVAAADTVNLGGLYGYASAALAYAAVDPNGGNALLESVDGLHSVLFVGVSKASLSASDFVL